MISLGISYIHYQLKLLHSLKILLRSSRFFFCDSSNNVFFFCWVELVFCFEHVTIMRRIWDWIPHQTSSLIINSNGNANRGFQDEVPRAKNLVNTDEERMFLGFLWFISYHSAWLFFEIRWGVSEEIVSDPWYFLLTQISLFRLFPEFLRKSLQKFHQFWNSLRNLFWDLTKRSSWNSSKSWFRDSTIRWSFEIPPGALSRFRSSFLQKYFQN